MKTYESERKELFDWMNRATDEYFDEVKNVLKKGNVERDGEANRKHLAIHREYIQKMRALKKKYGIE